MMGSGGKIHAIHHESANDNLLMLLSILQDPKKTLATIAEFQRVIDELKAQREALATERSGAETAMAALAKLMAETAADQSALRAAVASHDAAQADFQRREHELAAALVAVERREAAAAAAAQQAAEAVRIAYEAKLAQLRQLVGA